MFKNCGHVSFSVAAGAVEVAVETGLASAAVDLALVNIFVGGFEVKREDRCRGRVPLAREDCMVVKNKPRLGRIDYSERVMVTRDADIIGFSSNAVK